MSSTSRRFRWIGLALFAAAAIASAWFTLRWATAAFPVLGEFLRTTWHRPYSIIGTFELSPRSLTTMAVYVVLLWLGARIATRMLRTNLLDKTVLDEGHKFAFQGIFKYFVFGFGLLVGLHVLGIDLSSIALFTGALGIGLGLGFQTIVKNFASGLILLIERPVKVGDRVEVDNLLGDITHIGSRGTWIRTNENVMIIVPNSEFIDGRVTNWTANDRNVRINVPLGVSYGSDPEHVRSVLAQVAQEHPDVLNEPPSDVIFKGFGDSSLDFELRVWTARQVTTPKIIASDLYFKIFAAFKQEGIEIPFPQRDLHLRSVANSIPQFGA